MNDDPQPDGGFATPADAGVVEQAAAGEPAGWRQTLVVAGQEYRLAVRNRWTFALTGLFALLAVLLTGFAGSDLGPTRVEAVVVSLAQLAGYLVPLAALAFGFDAVVGAEEDGWLGVVFALPTPRSRVVHGTVLGRGATLAAATLVGFGLAGGVLVATAGVTAWPLFVTFLLGAVGLGVAFLALAVLGSTLAAEKTHALGLALGIWVWFVFLHDLVALGVVATVAVPDVVISAFVLANPVAVFRVLVTTGVNPDGSVAGVFAATGLSVPVLAATLLAWGLLPALLAGRLVRRRRV
jgi:Cu-processing system permease protein